MNPAALGLSAPDFDAYLPDRASSNAFSRPRLEFKQRALAWTRGVTSRLSALGISVDVHGSDEHPTLRNHHRVDCQWVFFWRDAAARADLDALLDLRRGIVETVRDPSPTFRHSFLALRVDAEGVEICVQVHPDAWLDFEVVSSRLTDPQRAPAIAAAIAKLPDQFAFGVGRHDRQSCDSASVETLVTALEQARAQRDSLWIGWRIARDVAVEHSALLDEQLEDAIIALAPVYRELSWSADDDPGQLRSALEQLRSDTQRQATERAVEDARRKAEIEALRLQTSEKSRERTREKVDYAARPHVSLANLFKPEPAATPQPPPARPQRPPPQRPQPPSRKPQLDDEPRESKPRAPARAPSASPRARPVSDAPHAEPPRPDFRDVELVDDPNGAVEKGAQVRVNSGPFAGKVGVVGEIDRGSARILLGLLSTRLAVADLSVVVEVKDRPPMHSSHRRPPIRSGK